MADTDKKPPKAKIGAEIGDSGVAITSGIITNEEYNPDLLGLAGMKIWDEMRRSDATVRMTLQALNTPVVATDWYVDTEGDSKKELEAKDFIQENLINIVKFKSKLPEILTMLPFGFSLFSLWLAPMRINGKLYIGLKDMAFRKQTTIQAWETRKGEPGVTQNTVRGVYDIPASNLVRFTYQQEGENYEGISVLRSAYKHWRYKEQLYKISAIGHERQAIGVPYAEFRQGASDKEKKDIEKYLRNLRANEEAFMMYPAGTKVGFMDMGASTRSDIWPDVNHHDRQISKNALLQFIEIGASGGSGTRSTSEDHSRLFEQAEEALADNIAETVTECVIKLLIDLNFSSGIKKYPKLRHGKLGDDNVPMLSDAIGKFVTAGALNPKPEDENIVRRLVGWTELTEEEIKERNELAKKARERLDEAGKEDKPGKDEDEPKTDEADAADKALKAAAALEASITRSLYGHQGEAA